MRNISITNILAAICALGLFSAGTAQAGPGQQQVYRPVKTYEAASALAPKTKIAITCPSCGAVSVSAVNKEKSHLKSFDCSVCKHSFELVPSGSGKASVGNLVCKDTKTGRKMSLKLCAEMHK